MTERVHLELSIEPATETEPLRGRIGDGTGEARDFSGWLGLMAATEAALTQPGEGER